VNSAAVQNLVYALDQVIHNFGAVAIVGFAVLSLLPSQRRVASEKTVFLALLIAWAIQGASGVIFGIVSLTFYGQLPDIHGIAVAAVSIKAVCVVLGLIVAGAGYSRASKSQIPRQYFSILSIGLGSIALAAAAFLRWFS